jgi:DNA polymerase-3 subunit chi
VTEVRFYHNAQDRLEAACAITTKAVSAGHKVVVFAPDASTAQRYDNLLWTRQPLSFVPHVAASSPLAARTPVLIARRAEELVHDDLLLNLADNLPEGYTRYAQLVEIVGTDEASRVTARERWRFYKQQSHPVQAFDLSKGNS